MLIRELKYNQPKGGWCIVYQSSQFTLKNSITEFSIQSFKLIGKSKKSLYQNLNAVRLRPAIVFIKKII